MVRVRDLGRRPVDTVRLATLATQISGASTMPRKIFINYRRGDEPGFALALYGRLETNFLAEDLFMDIEGGIPAGLDFVQVLQDQVARCDVFLAIIGQNWLSMTGERGERRLDNSDDFVRIEIESALRLGKRVIPVLVNRAEMPQSLDLPESLQPLARRHAVRLTQDRFRADTQGLITVIESALREADAAREAALAAETAAQLERRQARIIDTVRAARADRDKQAWKDRRPDFNYELLRQFAQNRLSASVAILLLIATVGFLSGLWTGVALAGAWTLVVTGIHAIITAQCRKFLNESAGRVNIGRWRTRFVILDLCFGIAWMSNVVAVVRVDEGASTFILFVTLLVVAVSSMLASSL